MPSDTARSVKALIESFFSLYPEEAARILEKLPLRELAGLLGTQTVPRAAALLERLTPDVASQVIVRLNHRFAGQVLAALEPVRASILLSRLNEGDRSRQLALLNPAAADRLQSIMTYPNDSAGNLMDPQTITFHPETTVREVLTRLRHLRHRRIHDILVVDSETRLLGAVPIQDIAISPLSETLGALLRGQAISIHSMATKEEVVDLMGRLRLASLPVVDLDGRVLGVIRHAALVTAAQEELSADIQTMVGASKEERALSKATFAVRKRLPWLQINLATAFLAASVVGLFENIIAQFTALAVLLPVVAGQSGNTGAQALAVTMRGLALREIRTHQWLRVMLKEFKVGLINGLAVTLTTSFAVYLWSQSIGLAIVIGLAMIISMLAAGISGVAVPMILTALGQDPAQSSSIILTTITDVVGFFSFLGTATLLSGIL
jgi:magnesium transporter